MPSALPTGWVLSGGTFEQVPSALSEGEELQQGQFLASPNGQFTLDMQTDGNLVEYEGGTAIWASGTSGNDFLAFQGDCNVVIYAPPASPSTALFTTGTGGGSPGCVFGVANDGTLSVVGPDGVTVWARYPNGTLHSHRIQMTSQAPMFNVPNANTGNVVGYVPQGDSPNFVCWTTGPEVGGVDVYFYVLWNGVAGYYPLYYDNSVYSYDARISIDYGIPRCGSVPTTFTPPTNEPTGNTPPPTISAPIVVTSAAAIDPGPGSGSPVATMPTGTSPGFLCWTTGPKVDGVDVWFNVYWAGFTGYYPSGLDNSTYAADGDITSKYGIPQCGGSSGGTGGGSGGSTVSGQAILNAATQWIGRTFVLLGRGLHLGSDPRSWGLRRGSTELHVELNHRL